MAFYKRTTFLIDPGFQLRFSVAVCTLVFLSSMIYPFIIWDFFNEIPSLAPDLREKIHVAREGFLYFLIAVQITFILFIFVLFVFLTHKIAGPLYKLRKHLAGIREGNPITPLTFRDGDHFPEVAEEVSLFLETISANQEHDFKYLDEVAAYVENLTSVVPDDKRPVLNEISRRLLDIQNRYKKPL